MRGVEHESYKNVVGSTMMSKVIEMEESFKVGLGAFSLDPNVTIIYSSFRAS